MKPNIAPAKIKTVDDVRRGNAFGGRCTDKVQNCTLSGNRGNCTLASRMSPIGQVAFSPGDDIETLAV